MKNILILMSTFNGDKYITEQLNSILSQKNVNIHLLIRDDGSTDATLNILKKYKSQYPNKIYLIQCNNLGCKESFFNLIIFAAENFKGYDYYAFSDQDDVWLPNKIYAATTSLDSFNNELKLYYCKPQYVDQYLNYLTTNTVEAKGTLPEAFILAPALGCSMVFNEPVLKILSEACAKNINCLHDTLAYRLTLALGGKVIYDNYPHLLYRQHSLNVVGGVQSTKKRWKRRIGWFIKGNRYKSEVARDILKYFDNRISEEHKEILRFISSYHHSLYIKYKILSSKKFRSNKRFHNIMFSVAIIFNKI